MGYIIDRQHVMRDSELVSVLSVRDRRVRSHVLLSDGSLVKTLTRPKLLIRALEQLRMGRKGLAWINDRRSPQK